jgi:hypothetical protein
LASGIRIPLISDWNPAGINKARRDFEKLETTGQKAALALKKAFLPATAALAGLAAAGVVSVKAAAEDAAQQAELARQLQATTGATDAAIAANEEFIASMELAVAVSDAELRPALANLVRGTGDLSEAQDLLGLALDISAATGKDLGSVTEAMSKAAQGQMTALQRLDPSITAVVRSGADADEVFQALAGTFGGAAAEAANTVEGRFERMQIQMDNASEAIGYALLPIIEKLLPYLERLATFIGDNTELILGIGGAVGTFAGAIVAANIAMKAWGVITAVTTALNTALGTSFTALWVATGVGIVIALIAVIVTLQAKFDILGKAVDGLTWLFQWLWDKAKAVMAGIVDGVNVLIDAWNKLPLLPDIPKIEAGFLTVQDSVTATGKVVDEAVPSWQAHTDSIAEDTVAAEISAAMMEQALVPALESTKVAVNAAAWELQGFYDQLDREDAFAKFSDELAAVSAELQGLEPGSEAFEATMRDAYRAVQSLSETLGYIPAELEKTLLYRVEIGDIAGAERLGALISASDTYRAVASDELRFLGGASSATSGMVNNITVNAGVGDPGSIGQAVVESISAYERRNGAGWRR